MQPQKWTSSLLSSRIASPPFAEKPQSHQHYFIKQQLGNPAIQGVVEGASDRATGTLLHVAVL